MARLVIIGGTDMPETARGAFMREFCRQRDGAHRLYQEGKCDLTDRPRCYDSCEFSSYCNEWKYTIRA